MVKALGMFGDLRKIIHGCWGCLQNIGIKYYQIVNLLIENISMNKSVDCATLSFNVLVEKNVRQCNHKTRLVK